MAARKGSVSYCEGPEGGDCQAFIHLWDRGHPGHCRALCAAAPSAEEAGTICPGEDSKQTLLTESRGLLLRGVPRETAGKQGLGGRCVLLNVKMDSEANTCVLKWAFLCPSWQSCPWRSSSGNQETPDHQSPCWVLPKHLWFWRSVTISLFPQI